MSRSLHCIMVYWENWYMTEFSFREGTLPQLVIWGIGTKIWYFLLKFYSAKYISHFITSRWRLWASYLCNNQNTHTHPHLISSKQSLDEDEAWMFLTWSPSWWGCHRSAGHQTGFPWGSALWWCWRRGPQWNHQWTCIDWGGPVACSQYEKWHKLQEVFFHLGNKTLLCQKKVFSSPNLFHLLPDGFREGEMFILDVFHCHRPPITARPLRSSSQLNYLNMGEILNKIHHHIFRAFRLDTDL